MQKLDFQIKIEELKFRLRSDLIVKLFNEGFANPHISHDYGNLRGELFASKSQFDQLMLDNDFAIVLNDIPNSDIYSEANLAALIPLLTNSTVANILTSSRIVKLYNFHNSLISSVNIFNKLLKNKALSDSYETDIENGLILFQITIAEEGIPTSQYVKIFSLLDELSVVVDKIHNKEIKKSEIVILDSGSSSIVGVKTGVETAKSIFLIFKEIWDYVTKFRFVREKQKHTALLDSLTIRKEIQAKVEEGVISEAEAKEYIHLIKTRTDDLIGLKVLPKQLTLSKESYDSNRMLEEYESIKMISSNK